MRPAVEAPVRRAAEIGELVRELLVDVLQARRHGLALGHGEAVAARLPGLVVRVLAHNDHLDLLQRRGARPGVDQLGRRVDGAPGALLGVQEALELRKARLLHCGLQAREPLLVHRGALQGERVVRRKERRHGARQRRLGGRWLGGRRGGRRLGRGRRGRCRRLGRRRRFGRLFARLRLGLLHGLDQVLIDEAELVKLVVLRRAERRAARCLRAAARTRELGRRRCIAPGSHTRQRHPEHLGGADQWTRSH